MAWFDLHKLFKSKSKKEVINEATNAPVNGVKKEFEQPFKDNNNPIRETPISQVPTVPVEEKKYYQPDEYYKSVLYAGTPFEKNVITFDKRKKTAIPSNRGLYPAEILLLHYCSKGTYPHPAKGYPGFWWFEYGIRDVGAALKTLEKRSFITFGTAKESLKLFTVAQLKKLLYAHNKSVTGKKSDLIERIADNVPEEILLESGVTLKYKLTELGQQELEENAYVPYMHSCPYTTAESDFDTGFNVWSINKLLGRGDKTNWKIIVEKQDSLMRKEIANKNDAFMKSLKEIDPEGYKKSRAQDLQLKAIIKADNKFKEDKDLEAYIKFWEKLWEKKGLTFEGLTWHFKLPDLYIMAKRYDEALEFVCKIKTTKSNYYINKADSYIEKIKVLKEKALAKSEKQK